jgi:nucleotide-binding universal stress UspA family protein
MSTKILIPIDDSDASRRAIDFVARRDAQAEVVLLNVRSDPEYMGELAPLDYQALDRAQREAQQQLLAKAAAHAEKAGLKTVTIAVAQGTAGEAIARLAQERGIDQIVMGTHGRGSMGTLLLGSVAQRVVHLVPVPVTLVK